VFLGRPDTAAKLTWRAPVRNGRYAREGDVDGVTLACVMRDERDDEDAISREGVRLDKWLWAARFFKTRSLATEAVNGGKVELNGLRPKAAKEVKVGDRVRVRVGPFVHELTVRALGERRGPASVAALLYEESAESVAARERLREQHRMAPAVHYEEGGRPTKKDRRALSAFDERQRRRGH
jgi:ribosome-associated heat shock protein Hsp15